MTRRRRLLWVLVAAAAVAFGAVAVGVRAVLPTWLHSSLERAAGAALGRSVRIAGRLDLTTSLHPTIAVEDVTLANVPWGSEPSMARVARARVTVELASLWNPPLRIEDLEIDGVRVTLERDAGGRGNWELGTRRARAATARPPLVLEHAAIRDLEMVYRGRPGRPPLRFGVGRLEARLDPATRMIDLEAAGNLNDAPWDVAGQLGTFERLLELRDLQQDVTGHVGQTKIALRGRVRDPIALGDPNVELTIEGPDIAAAQATVGFRSPLSGPFRLRGRLSPLGEGVDLDLTVAHAGVTASVRGHVSALLRPEAIDARIEASGPDASVLGGWVGLVGLPPRPFDAAGRVRRDGSRFSIDGMKARVGGTAVAASGTLGEPPRWVGTDVAVTASGTDLSELSALARLRLPDGGFAVRGRFLCRPDALAVEDLEVRTEAVVVRGSGTLGEPPRFQNLDLAIDASGEDLSSLSKIARVDLPRAPFALGGRIARRGAAFELDGVEGRLGDSAVELKGRLVAAPRLAGTDLHVRAEGPDLAAAASLVGAHGLPSEPYEVSGQVGFGSDGYDVEGVEARAGRISASAAGHLGARPAEDGTAVFCRLQGPALSDLAAWGVDVPLPDEPFTASGHLRVERGVFHADHAVAEVGADRAALDGTLGPLPASSALDVGLELSGPSLADLGRFLPAAGGEIRRGLPPEPYAFTGRVCRTAAGIELVGARANVGNAEIRLDGTLGAGEKLRGTDVRFEARAPDTSLAATVVGATLPAGPIEVRGRFERLGAGFRLESVAASIGEARAEVSGTLGEPPALEGTDLDVSVAGPDLAEILGPVTGLSPLPSEGFEASAHLERNADGLASRAFSARLGVNDLEGSVSVRLGDRPFVEADLRSQHLGMARLLDGSLGEPAAAPEPPRPAKKRARKRDRFIPDSPLALDALRSADARVRLTAAEVAIPGMLLHDVAVEARVRDGALHVDRMEGSGELGGRAKASLALEPVEDGYRLRASGGVAGGKIGRALAGDGAEQSPSLELDFEVEGAGRSLHDIASSSDGRAVLTLGPGRVPTNLSDFMTSGVLRGLLDALNPFRKSSAYTEVECAVAVASLESGKAAVEPIAVRTDKLTILGHGKVDLDTEGVDLVWTLKPRKGVGISAGSIANPYIKLGGSLSSPSLEAKPLEAVASTGAAVATAGLTVLFRGIYDRITAEKKVCVKALEKARRQEEKNEARNGS